MYILSKSGKEIVNSDFVERFCVTEKSDAMLIVASYSTERQPVTMARYRDSREAEEALRELFRAMAGEQRYFEMPDSVLQYGERQIKDSRVKRKGGS